VSVSQAIRQHADSIWEAQHSHPFVQGIGDGSLPIDRFQHWLRQDYRYLTDYARVFAATIVKAPDLETMTMLTSVQHALLHMEMGLHRSYAEEFGISSQDLEGTVMAPTCRGYVDFLLRTATTGDYAEAISAVLPCVWGYSEIGQRLARIESERDPRYQAWIDMYNSPDMEELATWCRGALDAACDGLPERLITRVRDVFVTSSRWELAFWEMAWTLEEWPV